MSKLFLSLLMSGAITFSSAIMVEDLTDFSGNAQTLVNLFIGEGITAVGDPVMIATDKSIGVYTDATVESQGQSGLLSGIVLSTGEVKTLNSNENLYDNVTGYLHTGSDDDLLSLLPDIDPNTNLPPLIYDVTTLSQDFIATEDGVASFEYVFGSDEYDEWVFQFNDVFGFFLDGENIATIPGTSTPVSINNINFDINSGLYNRNDLDYYSGGPVPFATEMDGFTTPLSVEFPVRTGQQFNLKLAIGDEGDRKYDSWILLGAHSFTVTPDAPQCVPEPGFFVLFLIGISLLFVAVRLRKN